MLLAHPDADCFVEPVEGSLKRVTVKLVDTRLFMPRSSVVTSYPLELIEWILSVKGPGYLCDEIAREEDSGYIRFSLETDLGAYFLSQQFAGKRILDFGCGSGASTMILSRIFPNAEVFGIELDEDLLSVAKARARYYGFPERRLLLSPGGTEVPPRVGQFDCVVMSAVFEHLLPQERRILLPKIWDLISDDGFLFVNQTPYRFTPIETHTTGLPLINYLPDHLARWAACRFSGRIAPHESWETLLRKGIRGATEYEIITILKSASAAHFPVLLEPNGKGIRDRVDLWAVSAQADRASARKAMRLVFKLIRVATGLTLVPYISLALRKRVR